MSPAEAQVWIGTLELSSAVVTGGASLEAGAAGEALNAATLGIATAGLGVSGSFRVMGTAAGSNPEQVAASAEGVTTLTNPAGLGVTITTGNLKAGGLAGDVSSVTNLARHPIEASKNPADTALTVKNVVQDVKDVYQAGKTLIKATPPPSPPKPPSPPACALQRGGC
jgi:hypothetical protein